MRLTDWERLSGLAGLGMIVTGLWAHLDHLGWMIGLGIWILWAVAFALARGTSLSAQASPTKRRLPQPLPVLASFVLLLPLVLHLVFTWRDEFPFTGDHDHHVIAGFRAAEFWSGQVWILVAGVVGFGLLRCWPKRPSHWPLFVLPLLGLASLGAEMPDFYFVRYPAGSYLATFPFFKWAEYFNWNSFYNASRLGIASALVVWLGCLRPWLFPRRVGAAGFWALALFVLLQKDFVYYLSSPYLESWSLIFILLSLESLFDSESPPWQTVALAGVACWFKDTAVLVFPFLVAASWVQNRRIWTLRTLASATLVSLLPFVLYYAARRQGGVWRTVGLPPFAEAFSSNRIGQWQFRFVEQMGWTGLMALGLGLALVLWQRNSWRVTGLLWLGALSQMLFLFVDEISQVFAGYPRFQLLPLTLLMAPLLQLEVRNKTWLWGGLAVMGGLQAWPLLSFLSASSQPSLTRSFTETYSVPYHLPIAELVQRAEQSGDLVPGSALAIFSPFENVHLQFIPLVYRHLFQRYSIQAVATEASSLVCSCKDLPTAGILVPHPQSMNLYERWPRDILPYAETISRLDQSCGERLKASCRQVHESRLPDGRVVGWLGIK